MAGVLAYLNELGPDVESTKDIYVTGVVTSVKEAFSTQYGNAQFVISDTEDGTNQFTFYRGLYLGNKKYANENDVNIQENDVVVICGKIVNYRGSTPETVQGKAYVVSINGKGADVPEAKTGEAKGAGTQADPYNVAGVLNYLNGLGADVTSPNEVYIKGKVKEITEQFGTQYGNATFTMIDEGFDAVFTAYRVLYLGNKKYTEGDLLKENDEVIVCGKVVNFKGNTPETSQNTGFLYSLNGKTADGGGGGSSEVKTVSIADFNAAPVSDTWYQLTGTVKNLKDGDQYGNFDLEDATGSVYVYGLLSEKGGEKKKFQDLVAAKGITEGSKITIIGNRGEYNGKIEVLNAYFVSIEGGNEPGGGGGGETTDAGTSADNPFTPAQANAFIAGLDADQNTEQDYYIKGKIIEITDKNQFNTQYGNCTFYISDDGTDKDEKFYVFRTLYLGNVKYNDESWTLPKAGDEVVICGKVVNYKGNTPETVANKSYIYSLNGKTAARKK